MRTKGTKKNNVTLRQRKTTNGYFSLYLDIYREGVRSCPNLFTGGMNFHGKFEYCSVDTMGRACETLVNLARLWAE